MKTSCLVLLLLMLPLPLVLGQTHLPTDSLKRMLSQTRQDTSRVLLLAQIAGRYRFFSPDSSMVLVQQAMRLADRLNFPKGKAQCLFIYGDNLRFRGEFPQALKAQLEALQISKDIQYLEGEEICIGTIGLIYLDLDQYQQALHYLVQATKINQSRSDKYLGSRWLSGLGQAYERMNRLDSALVLQQQAYSFVRLFPSGLGTTNILNRLGVVHWRLGHVEQALRYYQDAIKTAYVTKDIVNASRAQYRIAELYHSVNQADSSLYYARLAFANAQRVSLPTTILEASNLLTNIYKANNKLDSAFHYQQVALATKDALYGREKFQQLQLLMLTEQQRQLTVVAEQKEYQDRIRFYALLGGVAMLLLLAVILVRNNQQKQKANNLLQQQKQEIDVQRTEAENTLTELKATQAQLIQKEKMASLGELTAGIAHEIQNPLNFVNNFSEVSNELVDELKQGPILKLPDSEKADADEIIGALSQNLTKITLHGQRASAIVKGMLEHSRTSTGEKQPTDLNALTDEYLRLAYHGLRAKDKDFNAELNLDVDPELGLVELVPQEIGRVLLNLFNNAFYAVQEKKKQHSDGYQPTLRVSTKQVEGGVEIRVRDNGTGMPEAIKPKIFQPFFTTKPTGQGTGLGLSLAYDIITKAHGGRLSVESTQGEYTEFVVGLPTPPSSL